MSFSQPLGLHPYPHPFSVSSTLLSREAIENSQTSLLELLQQKSLCREKIVLWVERILLPRPFWEDVRLGSNRAYWCLNISRAFGVI
ncbi:hypothetical protein CEXT_795671 [Caerostris extrusa]|uniref:Uncharacterized protein n=1 Tax=Caerostris extrusa TaxID=172846 RepID=A0AAV4X5Y1_CAEEX|nr:hypothetical protein CEXT_795671 [Caerostris extrusa]